MKYLINLSIIFDVNNKLLSLYGDDKVFINLTNPAARLLIELIKNNGVELTRDNLLASVWTDYGFADSNASLNNCISELRKAFIALGMTRKVILTIQKVGFRFDAQLQSMAGAAYSPNVVKPDNDENRVKLTLPGEVDNAIIEEQPSVDTVPAAEMAPCTSQLTEEIPEPEPEPEPEISIAPLCKSHTLQGGNKQCLRNDERKLIAKRFALLFAAAIGTASVSILLFHPKSAEVFLYQKDQCRVATLGNAERTTGLMQRVKAQITEQNIDCKTTRRDIFYVEQKHKSKVNNITLLTVCDVTDSKHYGHCQNFKHVE